MALVRAVFMWLTYAYRIRSGLALRKYPVVRVPSTRGGRKEETPMTRQVLSTDLIEVAIAKYAGYSTRFLFAEQQWAILDPGDLNDLLADVRAGKQAIADARGLLKAYEEVRKIMRAN